MTLPIPDPSTWFTGQMIDEAKIRTYITDPINALPRGYLADATDTSGTKTLASAGTDVASTSAGSVTFTLTEQRRVAITVKARFVPAAVLGAHYTMYVGYNTGSSVTLGSVVRVSTFAPVYNNPAATGAGGATSQMAVGTVLLAAGTFTTYGVVQRANGGDPADLADQFYTLVNDIGAV